MANMARESHLLHIRSRILLRLAKSHGLSNGDLVQSFREILAACAQTLHVSRVGIWMYAQKKAAIRCVASYSVNRTDFVADAELLQTQFPIYFEALDTERVIAAHDAHTNPYTSEFTETYLKPLGISSMLDAPIRWEGAMIGVVCCEHTGPARNWTAEEEYFLGSITDFITLAIELWKRKNIENQLNIVNEQLEQKVHERTQQLEHSNEELKRFAYAASHDLREPLRTIMGFAQLLERHIADKLDDAGREYMRYITNGTQNMSNLVTELLNYSRMTTIIDEDYVDLDCEDLIGHITAGLRRQLIESEAAINFPAIHIVLYGIRSQILRLFQNLISNAIKFVPRGQTPQINLSCLDMGSYWQFAIADNGIGIAPEYSEQIFTLFKRLHTKTEYGGSGIGLALCKRIVEQHGGRIWVKSQLGQGSTFYFTLAKRP